MEEYLYDFMNSKRHRRTLRQRPPVSMDEASTVFGVAKEALKKENRRGLPGFFEKRPELIRTRARDHDKFVKLTEAYHELLKKISRSE